MSNSMEPVEVGTSNYLEWKSLEREHRVYACLALPLAFPLVMKDCIVASIIASSTDNYPIETIENTLDPSDRTLGRYSYWSSKGANNPEVPETLTYRLASKLCVVNEINIRPFQASFQYGHPIYSAQAVRFKMGYSKNNIMDEILPDQIIADDEFIWTYVSPIFPMAQENRLQTFELPQPILCIGGILQIELLGRVQKQQTDGLYYICVCHVHVVGRPLSDAFDVDTLDFPRKCVLKYSANAEDCSVSQTTAWLSLVDRLKQIRQMRTRRVLNNAIQGIWFENNVVNDEVGDADEGLVLNHVIEDIWFENNMAAVGEHGDSDEELVVADGEDGYSDEELVL
ncbi:F-box protein At4g00755-like isoform X2 [Tasmannia lanceolata]